MQSDGSWSGRGWCRLSPKEKKWSAQSWWEEKNLEGWKRRKRWPILEAALRSSSDGVFRLAMGRHRLCCTCTCSRGRWEWPKGGRGRPPAGAGRSQQRSPQPASREIKYISLITTLVNTVAGSCRGWVQWCYTYKVQYLTASSYRIQAFHQNVSVPYFSMPEKKENTTKRLWYITHIRYGWVGYLQIFRILFITLYCESCTDQNIKDGDLIFWSVLICLFFISLFHKLLSWILQSNFNTPSWPADGTLCLKTTNPFQHSCFKMLQKLCFPNHLKAYINPFEAYLITFFFYST